MFDGRTALMGASLIGMTEIVKYLIHAGAEVNVADKDGKTSLMRASLRGHTDTTELLISKGAEVNAVDNNG